MKKNAFENMLFAVIGALLIVMSTSAHAQDEPNNSAYSIHNGDKLSIKVFRENDLSGIYPVDNLGNITYPLIGDVKVDGLMPEEVKRILTERLKTDYLVNPQVQVEISESAYNSVTVVGQVKQPGTVALQQNETLLGLIFKVGGSVDPSKLQAKVIRRSGDGLTREFHEIYLQEIITGEKKDMYLEPGDMIFIYTAEDEILDEKEEDKPYVSVLGEVKNPGNYELEDNNKSIVRMIARAGGFTKFALSSHVKLTRFSEDGVEDVYIVNAGKIMDGKAEDVPLEENDLIYVPESFF